LEAEIIPSEPDPGNTGAGKRSVKAAFLCERKKAAFLFYVRSCLAKIILSIERNEE